jgi:hypothetical protein
MAEKMKYPHTPHLPFSECVTSDDTFLTSVDHLIGMNVVVTEKMDGEGFTLAKQFCHARSLDSRDHPSRHIVKNLWGKIAWEIPESFRVTGENIYAKHSIYYVGLKAYFQVFAIFDGDVCLSWKDTVDWCKLLNLVHVPVLYSGLWNETKIRACMTGKSTQNGEQEGYVVRNVEAFPFEAFDRNYAKYVRRGHVTCSEHWLDEAIVPNLLAPDAQ